MVAAAAPFAAQPSAPRACAHGQWPLPLAPSAVRRDARAHSCGTQLRLSDRVAPTWATALVVSEPSVRDWCAPEWLVRYLHTGHHARRFGTECGGLVRIGVAGMATPGPPRASFSSADPVAKTVHRFQSAVSEHRPRVVSQSAVSECRFRAPFQERRFRAQTPFQSTDPARHFRAQSNIGPPRASIQSVDPGTRVATSSKALRHPRTVECLPTPHTQLHRGVGAGGRG